MARFHYVLRSVIILLVTSKLVCAESRDDKLEDIILSAVQSIASLNGLVTDLAVKVSRMTVSLSELQAHVAETKQSLIEQTNAKIEGEVAQTNNKIEKEVAALTTSVAQTNEKIEATLEMGQGEVMIVSGEQAPGNEKCIKVCAGTTGRDTTDWNDFSTVGVYYDVDISDCKFITVPTVTSAIEGSESHWRFVGTASIYHTSTSSFRMYLRHIHYDDIQDYADEENFNVEWIAVGYTC